MKYSKHKQYTRNELIAMANDLLDRIERDIKLIVEHCKKEI